MKAKKPKPIDSSNIPVVNICSECGGEMRFIPDIGWSRGYPFHYCLKCGHEEEVKPRHHIPEVRARRTRKRIQKLPRS